MTRTSPATCYLPPYLECAYSGRVRYTKPSGSVTTDTSSTYSGCVIAVGNLTRGVGGPTSYWPHGTDVRGYWSSWSTTGFEYIRKATIHS